MEIEISEDFRVLCATCGGALEATVEQGVRDRFIEIEPCDKCLNEAMADGEANAKMDSACERDERESR